MKILILGVDYAPDRIGIAPYTTDLAEHLVSRGHHVTVVTTFPHYPTYRWTSGHSLYATQHLNGVRLVRVWCRLPRHRATVSRILFDTTFSVAAFAAALFQGRPCLVIGVCVPAQAGVVAAVLGRFWKVPSIVMIQDLPVSAAVAVGMLRGGSLTHRLGAGVERMAFTAPTQAVVVNSRFRRYLLAAGADPAAISELPNWVREESPRLPPRESSRRSLELKPDDLLIVHAGNIGEKQDLRNVVRAAALLDERCHVVVAGDGLSRPEIEREVSDTSSRVKLLGLLDTPSYNRILAAADVFVVNQQADLVDSVIPSKLIAYMAVGRPVVAAVHPGSIVAEVVAEAKCGLTVAAGQPEALARALMELQADDKRRKRMGRAGRDYVASHFLRAEVLGGWDALISRMTNP